jgi:hypothetical protein
MKKRRMMMMKKMRRIEYVGLAGRWAKARVHGTEKTMIRKYMYVVVAAKKPPPPDEGFRHAQMLM